MKLVMTLLVRNEEDIIKQNIDYHLSQGVDFIIAMDNRSTDSTKEILKFYEKKGLLYYLYQESDTHNQGVWVTQMARMAAQFFQATWIINNDADEFWWPSQHRNLKSAFQSLSEEINVVEAKRNNFVFIHLNEGDVKFHTKMIYKERVSFNTSGKQLPPKQAHKANENILVSDGNHSVQGFVKTTINHELIEIFHFPLRSKTQFTNKILNGGAALERNSELSKNTGSTWKILYNQLNAIGNLDSFFSSQFHDKYLLKEKICNGSLVIDERLSKHLKRIYNAQH